MLHSHHSWCFQPLLCTPPVEGASTLTMVYFAFIVNGLGHLLTSPMATGISVLGSAGGFCCSASSLVTVSF
jgi:hypothetical protein